MFVSAWGADRGSMEMNSLRSASIFVLLALLPACRMVTERDAATKSDAAAKRETAGGVSVVAVQYVASVSWSCLAFTDLSHFMV